MVLSARGREATKNPNERTPLCNFIEGWLADHDLNWAELLRRTGLPIGMSTQIRAGSTPRLETLRAIAGVMGVPRRVIFEVAGYLEPDEVSADWTPWQLEIATLAGQIPEEQHEFARKLLRILLPTAWDPESDQLRQG